MLCGGWLFRPIHIWFHGERLLDCYEFLVNFVVWNDMDVLSLWDDRCNRDWNGGDSHGIRVCIDHPQRWLVIGRHIIMCMMCLLCL